MATYLTTLVGVAVSEISAKKITKQTFDSDVPAAAASVASFCLSRVHIRNVRLYSVGFNNSLAVKKSVTSAKALLGVYNPATAPDALAYVRLLYAILQGTQYV